jgi:hypothetical protein
MKLQVKKATKPVIIKLGRVNMKTPVLKGSKKPILKVSVRPKTLNSKGE